jgi:hypothetical protein
VTVDEDGWSQPMPAEDIEARNKETIQASFQAWRDGTTDAAAANSVTWLAVIPARAIAATAGRSNT